VGVKRSAIQSVAWRVAKTNPVLILLPREMKLDRGRSFQVSEGTLEEDGCLQYPSVFIPVLLLSISPSSTPSRLGWLWKADTLDVRGKAYGTWDFKPLAASREAGPRRQLYVQLYGGEYGLYGRSCLPRCSVTTI